MLWAKVPNFLKNNGFILKYLDADLYNDECNTKNLQILFGENLKESSVSYSFCVLKNFRRIATV